MCNHTNAIVNTVASIILVMIICGLIAASLIDAGTHEVWKSYSTNECVKVIPGNKYSCDNLPEKYHMIWVR